jgi:hypothetical protein
MTHYNPLSHPAGAGRSRTSSRRPRPGAPSARPTAAGGGVVSMRLPPYILLAMRHTERTGEGEHDYPRPRPGMLMAGWTLVGPAASQRHEPPPPLQIHSIYRCIARRHRAFERRGCRSGSRSWARTGGGWRRRGQTRTSTSRPRSPWCAPSPASPPLPPPRPVSSHPISSRPMGRDGMRRESRLIPSFPPPQGCGHPGLSLISERREDTEQTKETEADREGGERGGERGERREKDERRQLER